ATGEHVVSGLPDDEVIPAGAFDPQRALEGTTLVVHVAYIHDGQAGAAALRDHDIVESQSVERRRIARIARAVAFIAARHDLQAHARAGAIQTRADEARVVDDDVRVSAVLEVDVEAGVVLIAR